MFAVAVIVPALPAVTLMVVLPLTSVEPLVPVATPVSVTVAPLTATPVLSTVKITLVGMPAVTEVGLAVTVNVGSAVTGITNTITKSTATRAIMVQLFLPLTFISLCPPFYANDTICIVDILSAFFHC
jgi:hypothetical protein